MEQKSEHPIATGIVLKANELKLPLLKTEGFDAITGKGVEAIIDGKKLMIVSPSYVKEKLGADKIKNSGKENQTIVYVLIDDELVGFIALADEIRPESAAAIKTLHENGIKSFLLTGDNSKVAKSVSDQLKTAGIILVNSNPKDITNLILFGKATYRKMIQNLIWATGYNVVALPLAAGVLYNYGILLSPAAGAVLMSASTIVVAINAKFLKIK